MLERVQNGYALKEGVTLTEEQQQRYKEIKNYPAGFIPDYEQYITDGSMPSEYDEEGNKRNLAVHPMRDLMIESWQHLQDEDLETIIEILEGE